MSWPRRTVEPALQVGCAKTDFRRDQKANCGAGNEKHEVLIESRKDEGAEGFRRLWPGSDCFQTEKIGNNERSSERAGRHQENERPPGISTRPGNHRPLSNIDIQEFDAQKRRRLLWMLGSRVPLRQG